MQLGGGGFHGVNAVSLSPAQFSAFDHVIYVRLHLAERKTHLMWIKRPFKYEGHNLSSGARYFAASCCNSGATFLVMTNNLDASNLRLTKGQLVTGQDQGFRRQQSLQAPQRTDVKIEGITVRFDSPDANVRRDFGEDLIRCKEQFLGRTMQHQLFRSVSVSAEHILRDEATESRRQAGHHLEIAVTARGNLCRRLSV